MLIVGKGSKISIHREFMLGFPYFLKLFFVFLETSGLCYDLLDFFVLKFLCEFIWMEIS
jgi:hypothetical protein